MIGVFAFDLRRFFGGEIINTLHGFEVEFAPNSFSLSIDEAERMAAKTVHLAVVFRRTAIGKQNSYLMQSFWTQRPEIPLGVSIFEMGLGMALLRVDQIREFERIADEENRGVVAY